MFRFDWVFWLITLSTRTSTLWPTIRENCVTNLKKRIHLTCCLLHKNISAVKLFRLVYPCSSSQFVVLKPAENIVVKWKEMHSPSLICLRTQHAALFLYVLSCPSSYPPFPSMINGTGAPNLAKYCRSAKKNLAKTVTQQQEIILQ